MHAPAHAVLRGLDELTRPGPPGLVLGVSGGADSLALLLAVYQTRDQHQLPFEVVHVQHHLRGAASEADAACVQAACTERDIPFHIVHHPVDPSSGVEEKARNARRQAWRAALEQRPGWAVALGHHADDQAETLLWRLARGGSPRGVAGMQPWQEQAGLHLFRPFLCLRHAGLCDYLRAHRVVWREDASNREPVFLRNRVRHQLLPAFQEAWERDPVPGISEAAAMLAEDDDWLSLQAAELLATVDAEAGLPLAFVRELHPALARRVVLAWLDSAGHAWSARAMHNWLADPRPLQLPGGVGTLVLEDGRLRVHLSRRLPAPSFDLPLPPPGESLVPEGREWRVRVEELPVRHVETAPGVGRYPAAACLPHHFLGRLRIRSWQAGDRYRPLGLHGGSRKLQDVWGDAKVPRERRGEIPVISDGDTILWVAGGEVALEAEVADDAPCLRVVVEAAS